MWWKKKKKKLTQKDTLTKYIYEGEVVQAWKFTRENLDSYDSWVRRYPKEILLTSQYGGEVLYIEVRTSEGLVKITEGDLIYKLPSGEFKAIKKHNPFEEFEMELPKDAFDWIDELTDEEAYNLLYLRSGEEQGYISTPESEVLSRIILKRKEENTDMTIKNTAVDEILSESFKVKKNKVKKNKVIENNFSYHSPKEGQPEKYTQLRNKAKELAYLIDELCPNSRERALATTKLEEAIMWANASIARQDD